MLMKLRMVAIFFACLAFATISRAEYIAGDMEWDLWDDGDGVISCDYAMTEDDTVDYDDYSLDIDGDHNRFEPGHLIGWFRPGHSGTKTIKVSNKFRNLTDFNWTDYHIDVSMRHPFTISNADVISPNDWTSAFTQPVYDSDIDKWVGTVDYYAGTPVRDGIYNETLRASYKITFSGTAGHNQWYWQQLTPTPEPSTLVLLACGLLGLLAM